MIAGKQIKVAVIIDIDKLSYRNVIGQPEWRSFLFDKFRAIIGPLIFIILESSGFPTVGSKVEFSTAVEQVQIIISIDINQRWESQIGLGRSNTDAEFILDTNRVGEKAIFLAPKRAVEYTEDENK